MGRNVGTTCRFSHHRLRSADPIPLVRRIAAALRAKRARAKAGRVMLGHLSFGVSDLARSMRFYDAALAALGFVRVWTTATGAGYGEAAGADRLAIFGRGDAARAPGAGFHLAFSAPSRSAVDAFHTAALANGGTCSGAPGLRSHYSPTYYAAFVVDPDGYKLEAVHQ
jgi:catechol 2,3-dioxygenase-like lactoylglutathione lyase family enzyme